MTSWLESRLDAILEADASSVADEPYQAAMNIANELEASRRQVADLERQLMWATDRLCGGLALGIRKSQPGLHVGLNKGACKVGYRSKSLMLKPDLINRVWIADSADPAFLRRFQRTTGPQLNLSSDLVSLASTVAKFFNDHYLSLGEEIEGVGKILHDDRPITYGRLAEIVQEKDRLLMELRIRL